MKKVLLKDGNSYIPLQRVKINYSNLPTQLWIAASNSSNEDKELADIILDGNNDAEILNRIIRFYSENNGGKINLFAGKYIINELKEVTVGTFTYKYGLYCPNGQGEVIIQGCGIGGKATNISITPNYKGVWLCLSQNAYNSISDNDNVSLIGGYAQWTYTYKRMRIKEVNIAIPNYTKPITAINGNYFSEISVEDCVIMATGSETDNSGMTEKCVGLRTFSGGNNGICPVFKHIKIMGFGTGAHIAGEHTICETVSVQRCKYGFVFGNVNFLERFTGNGQSGIHCITMLNCCFERVLYGITLGERGNLGPNTINFIDLNGEFGERGSTWEAVKIFQDLGNNGFFGKMSYYITNSSSGYAPRRFLDNLSEQSQNFVFENLMAKKMGTTSQRPTNDVEVGFPYFDTTINKMVYRTPTGWTE